MKWLTLQNKRILKKQRLSIEGLFFRTIPSPIRYKEMKNEQVNLLKGYNLLLYFGGGMIMSEPTDECVIDFWATGSLNKLPIKSSNPRFLMAASLLRDSCPDRATCRNLLISDFRKLLDISGSPMAPAKASAYIQGTRNNGNIETEITDFYKSYGWEPSQSAIPGDHLGIELLFLTRMIDKYLSLDDVPCIIEMKNEIVLFIDRYLLSWLPAWTNKMNALAGSESFRGISSLIYACIEDIRGLMTAT
jgi:TorA maturation chaperone TorD